MEKIEKIAPFGFYNYNTRISSAPSNTADQSTLLNSSSDNQKASAFKLQSVNSNNVSLSDFKGKILIVDF